MFRSFFFLFLLFMMSSALFGQKLKYPQTRTEPVWDDYHGQKVMDPYRWLEDDNSEETKKWVEAQNKVTFSYLGGLAGRAQIRKRLEELWNYEKYSAPFKEGGYYFFYKNNGLQNQSVLFIQKSLEQEPEILLDPNKLSADGTTSLNSISVSKNGKYMAFSTSKAGSDWQQINVMNLQTRELLSDTLLWAKFTGMTWKAEGFYYTRYDEPEKGKEFSSENTFQKVYYHTLGEPQSQDKLIFEDPQTPRRYYGIGISEDERFVFLQTSAGTSGNSLKFMDLQNPSAGFVSIAQDMNYDYDLVEAIGENFYILTNFNAPKLRLVAVSAQNPNIFQAQVIIDQHSKNVLQSISFAGGKIFARYMVDATTRVYQHNLDGKMEREVELPGLGQASGFGGKKEDTELFYTFTSFTFPTTIYRYDISTGKSTVFRAPNVKFNPNDYTTKQVFFTSKDGTQVPMFIVHKKGLKLDGQNPTYLYSYGGFNISLLPSFSPINLYWLEAGGVYAMPNIRGGGEYGEEWHKAGMLAQKQNVFDDFIYAAEYLKKEKYTSSAKLAISGRSNGGLLVGAVMSQRPDLCKVALPGVGVLDMLRFHKFTVGWGWVVEYGTADKKEDFAFLYKYSPLHNLKKGTSYPATLITTADHDDRVVPAHSFKFAAALQAAHKGKNPVLIRIDVNAGHGAGKPTAKVLDEWADIWAFCLENLK
jgi:prolyl oligopeptidase